MLRNLIPVVAVLLLLMSATATLRAQSGAWTLITDSCRYDHVRLEELSGDTLFAFAKHKGVWTDLTIPISRLQFMVRWGSSYEGLTTVVMGILTAIYARTMVRPNAGGFVTGLVLGGAVGWGIGRLLATDDAIAPVIVLPPEARTELIQSVIDHGEIPQP